MVIRLKTRIQHLEHSIRRVSVLGFLLSLYTGIVAAQDSGDAALDVTSQATTGSATGPTSGDLIAFFACALIAWAIFPATVSRLHRYRTAPLDLFVARLAFAIVMGILVSQPLLGLVFG